MWAMQMFGVEVTRTPHALAKSVSFPVEICLTPSNDWMAVHFAATRMKSPAFRSARNGQIQWAMTTMTTEVEAEDTRPMVVVIPVAVIGSPCPIDEWGTAVDIHAAIAAPLQGEVMTTIHQTGATGDPEAALGKGEDIQDTQAEGQTTLPAHPP